MPTAPQYFNDKNVIKGPGKLWAGLARLASGVKLALDSNGDPDSTQNPNRVCIGMTKAGSTFTQTFKEQPQLCDEFTAAYRSDLDAEDATLEGALLEMGDIAKMSHLLPNATFVDGADYQQLTFGGSGSLANQGVALIAPRIDDKTKFIVAHLYQAHNTAGMKVQVTKKNDADSPFKFEAQIDVTRAEGDRLATFWKQKTTAEVGP